MSTQQETICRQAVTEAEIDPAQRPMLHRYCTWPQFHDGPRQSPDPLLKNLGRYPDAVLVAGCQRSGTTMLTRIIAQSAGFRALRLTRDDELDAGLALCGAVDLPANARYCFQTTYLNERYPEYRMLGPGHRLIWVLRNPYSVVYSMVYNWRRFGRNELYESCGLTLAENERQRRVRWPWPIGPSRLERACFSYAAKTAQIKVIRTLVPAQQLLIIDYDELVTEPGKWLPLVFDFVGEPYKDAYASRVRADSIGKANRLSSRERAMIARVAEPVHRECLSLVTRPDSR